MRVDFVNSISSEYKYWSNREVVKVIEHVLANDPIVFDRFADIISRYSKKSQTSLITSAIISTISSAQDKYRVALTTLCVLLVDLYISAKTDSELGSIRTATVEKFISEYIFKYYAFNNGHHCKVKIDGVYVDTFFDLDVAGWEEDTSDGEFHECKAGSFDNRGSQKKLNFLKELKKKLGPRAVIAISVFRLESEIVKGYYKSLGIEFLDRVDLSDKYHPIFSIN